MVTRFRHTRLVRLEWQLRSREDGRILRCGIYDTDEGQALMAGYDTGWLWYMPLESGRLATAAAVAADRWRRGVLATGGYDEIEQDARDMIWKRA
jgi:hypothetical protein